MEIAVFASNNITIPTVVDFTNILTTNLECEIVARHELIVSRLNIVSRHYVTVSSCLCLRINSVVDSYSIEDSFFCTILIFYCNCLLEVFL